ncbi:hypothetical protein Sru01_68250 [Sphaerisporangium rufum]|uniref:Uncharacterized protein n=1 Tax=Sphaerisporangium rufum TaxID=1381558 RepID=A0A919R9Q7_9ACTN|nr:hypothetical protein [Sphaerisporangium rufum]GII81843.1 hypothetical protein Sru01_68250 [Sphaerisporangium rufum]
MSSALLYLGIVLMWLCVLVPMWLRRDRHAIEVAEGYTIEPEDTLSDLPVPEAPGSDDEVTVNVPPAGGLAGVVKAEAPLPSGGAVGDHDSRQSGSSPLLDDFFTSEDLRRGGARPVPGPRHGDAPVAADLADEEAEAAADDPAAGDPGRPARRAGRGRRHRAKVMARRRRWLLWTVLLVVASVLAAAFRAVPWWGVTPAGVVLAGYLSVLRVAVTAERVRRAELADARAARRRQAREREAVAATAAAEAEAKILAFRRPAELFDQYADRPRRAVGG